MANPALHVVPQDPRMPYPMDLDRLAAAVSQFATLDQPNDHTSTAIRFSVGDERFVSSFNSNGRYLSVRRTWAPGPQFGTRRGPVLIALDNWNRTRYYPTLYTLETPTLGFRLVADATIDAQHGLSEAQLDEFLLIALSTCSEAIDFVSWAADKVLSLDSPPRHERF